MIQSQEDVYREAEIRRLVGLGWMDTQIAAHLGCHKSTVGKRRDRMGIELGNPPIKYGGGIEEELVECDAIDLRARVYRSICFGAESWAIAAEEGLTIMQVEVYRKQMPRWWPKGYGEWR